MTIKELQETCNAILKAGALKETDELPVVDCSDDDFFIDHMELVDGNPVLVIDEGKCPSAGHKPLCVPCKALSATAAIDQFGEKNGIPLVRPKPSPPRIAYDLLTTACEYHGCDRDTMARRGTIVAALAAITAGVEEMIFQLKRKRLILTGKDADVHIPMCEKDFYLWLANHTENIDPIATRFATAIVSYFNFGKKTTYIDEGDLKTLEHTFHQFWADRFRSRNEKRTEAD